MRGWPYYREALIFAYRHEAVRSVPRVQICGVENPPILQIASHFRFPTLLLMPLSPFALQPLLTGRSLPRGGRL
jgi:hypothetical protein